MNNQNPYRLKRNKIRKSCFIIGAFSMLASLLLACLDSWIGVELFTQLLMPFFIMPASILLAAAIPIAVYLSILSRKAKQLDTERAEAVHILNTGIVRPPVLEAERYPWGAALILLFLIPPIGLPAVIIKLWKERHRRLENALVAGAAGRVYTLVGLVACIFFLWIELDLISPGGMTIMVIGAIFPFVCGITMLIAWAILTHKGRQEAFCRKCIYIEGELSIDRIAAKLNKDYGFAVRLLQRLIDEEFLPDCYLDFKNRQIAVPVQLPKVARHCRFCGGSTVIIQGVGGICDYCGRILK